MDILFMKKVLPLYVAAGALTLRIAVISILLSAAAGLICAVVRYERIPVLRTIAGAYIELSRNTPLLIQLFFLYFAFPRIGILLSSTQCGIAGLTFLGGSYMAETFRSALETVPAAQRESGACIGLTKLQIMRFIIFPQACSVCVPGVCANSIFMIKETSVFSAVALADLMFVAKDLIGLYYKTDEALLLLAGFYGILLLPVTILSSWAERRVRYGQFGTR